MKRRKFLKILGGGSSLAILPAIAKANPTNIVDLVNEQIDKGNNEDLGGLIVPEDIAQELEAKLAHDKYLDNWGDLVGIQRKQITPFSNLETDEDFRERILAIRWGIK